VRGILRSVGEATDRAGVFLPAPSFCELFALERGAHQVIVRRPVEMPLPALVDAARALAPGQEVQSWRQLIPMLASMMDSTQGMMTFFFLIVWVAIAVVILNAMLVAVFERIKELGVLEALGFGPSAVLRLIFFGSMLQVGIAVVPHKEPAQGDEAEQ
jgi:ABC-type lipoprotein release transport system permease subunit